MMRYSRLKTVAIVAVFCAGVLGSVVAVASVATAPTGAVPPHLPRGKDLRMYQTRPETGSLTQVATGNQQKPLTYPISTPEPPPKGIIESGQAPLPGSLYTIQNQWQDVINGQWVQVYAGSLYSDPEQGVVIVIANSLDWSQPSPPDILLAPRTGALLIVASSGSLLTLLSAGGVTYGFNAATRQFI